MDWYWIVALTVVWLVGIFSLFCVIFWVEAKYIILRERFSLLVNPITFVILLFTTFTVIMVWPVIIIWLNPLRPWYVWVGMALGILPQAWSIPNLAKKLLKYHSREPKSAYIWLPFMIVFWPLNWMVEYTTP